MRSLLALCFGLLAVFSFTNVCGGTSTDDDDQEVNSDILASITYAQAESEAIEAIAAEIENELEDAITDTIVENDETSAAVEASKQNLPLMFPSLAKTGKSQRTLNQDMSVKVASIIEQAVILVANDILQTAVLLQTDPEEFLQANTTTSSE